MRCLLPLGCLLVLGCAKTPRPVAPENPGHPVTIAKLGDKRLDESSGVAPSRLHAGCYFTHNDSGDKARVFLINPARGSTRAITIKNARNVDWEDIASAEVDGKPYLFIGDIGDNAGKRDSITVYRVPEPAKGSVAEADQVYTLTYPDEPHNAETLMVHPVTGDIYVVTKAANKPSIVFKLIKPTDSGEYVLEKIGQVSVGGFIRESRTITGGAISPDGKRVVLRTYLGAYEYTVGSHFDAWPLATPRPIQTNADAQGEAITYALDGKSMITTSEGIPCQVSQITFGR